MRRALITAITATALLTLGGAAYAGTTGDPDPDTCTATQADNLVAVGGVCPVVDPTTLVDLDSLLGSDG